MKIKELVDKLKEKNTLNEFVTVCSKEEIKEIIEALEELGELRRLSYRAFKLLEEIAHL